MYNTVRIEDILSYLLSRVGVQIPDRTSLEIATSTSLRTENILNNMSH